MGVNSQPSSTSAICRSRRTTLSLAVVCVLTLCAVLTTPANGQGMRLCGQKLTRTLQAVCANKLCGAFAEIPVNKRAFEPHPFDEYALDYFKHPHFTSDLAYPVDVEREIQTYKRMADSPTWINSMRKRDGIATQCCERKCTYAYLKTFCCEEGY